MLDLLGGARLVDAVLAITCLEACALYGLSRWARRGPPPGEWALNLLSGVCLMLALRCALVQAGPVWLAAWLAGAGLAHAC
ncbi:MAG: hypothetical protein EOO24_32560, partial [Comamonadaceae bacterium]